MFLSYHIYAFTSIRLSFNANNLSNHGILRSFLCCNIVWLIINLCFSWIQRAFRFKRAIIYYFLYTLFSFSFYFIFTTFFFFLSLRCFLYCLGMLLIFLLLWFVNFIIFHSHFIPISFSFFYTLTYSTYFSLTYLQPRRVMIALIILKTRT